MFQCALYRYSIEDKDSPIGINPITGQLFTVKKLDRELVANHMFQVKAKEEPNGMTLAIIFNLINSKYTCIA